VPLTFSAASEVCSAVYCWRRERRDESSGEGRSSRFQRRGRHIGGGAVEEAACFHNEVRRAGRCVLRIWSGVMVWVDR